MVQAAGISRLTARTPGGAAPITAQELWRQCNRVILETNGKLALYNSAGAEVTGQEAKGFSATQSEIIFDLQKEPPAPGRNSFYIESSNPNAAVILLNGSSLPGDLSVINPNSIIVEGGFNSQESLAWGQPLTYDSMGRYRDLLGLDLPEASTTP